MSNKLYVQYGCGPFSSPEGWKNYDASPTLKLQKLPVVGKLLKKKMHVAFNDNILQGDIINGLPGIADNSCDGVFCSHVLEHLSYEDCLVALSNTYRILKPGGLFRCIVPDLEQAAREYLRMLDQDDPQCNYVFMNETLLGKKTRPRGIKSMITSAFGNSEHQFMWDHVSFKAALLKAGFKTPRRCHFNDSADEMFKLVEDEHRFVNAVAFEATK